MLRPALFVILIGGALWALLAGPLVPLAQAGLRPLGLWLLEQQRAFQTGLAVELRGLATGQVAAVWGLIGLCLAYGFLHAAGPGHGKAVLAAYATARRSSALRLVAVGLGASLMQAFVAITLVLALAGLVGLSRARVEALDQNALAPLALVAMILLGLWLVWRAAVRLRTVAASFAPAPPPAPAAPHAPAARGPASALLAAGAGGPAPGATVYGADPVCPDCGGRHLPDLTALGRASSGWETLGVIIAAGIRPCSGALLVLMLAWQMGMLWIGILGTLAMGLGTAGVTVTLALAAGMGRAGLMRAASGSAGPRLAAGIEAATGLVLVLAAASVLLALR